MTISNEDRLKRVHERAMERFDRTYTVQKDIRLQCSQDRRFVFVPGAQYDGDLGDQFANRPRFEINKVQQSVIRIFSEYRNNRVTVDFRADEDGMDDETPDFLDGLYRADEQDSGAQEAYDNAFDEGVAGGMGGWRVTTCYEDDQDEDDDRQRIRMELIPDADQSLFFDADAKRYDKSDSGHAFLITAMQDDGYDEEADEPGAAVIEREEWMQRRKAAGIKGGITSFDKVSRTGVFDWFAPDVIYVAEYYEVELTKETLSVYRHPASGEEEKVKRSQFASKEDYDAKVQELKDQGFTLAREKKTKAKKVHKYIIDGNKVLDDCGFIAGCEIPLVPFYAKRMFIDGVERMSGQVRLAIDLQRLYNMLASMLADIAVQSPMEKPIFTPEQIAGHEQMWARDSVERYPYTLINSISDPASGQTIPAGPLGYTKPPQIPPALAGLIQLVGADLQEVLGSAGDQQEVVSNISAKAVELIQNRLDMQNFIYMDNFKKSMKRCGEIWLSMSRDLYDEEDRPMRTVNLDGSDEVKTLRQKTVNDQQKEVYKNDPAAGKFKVVTDVGPSFTTRRDGTVRSVTGLMQFVEDPADKAVLTGVAIQNLEGEGLEEIKQYWRRKMVAMGVTKPTDDEQKELDKDKQEEKPDPQAQFLLAEANKSMKLGNKAEADTLLSLKRAEESEANAAAQLATIEAGKLDQILAMLDRMIPQAAAGAQQGVAA